MSHLTEGANPRCLINERYQRWNFQPVESVRTNRNSGSPAIINTDVHKLKSTIQELIEDTAMQERFPIVTAPAKVNIPPEELYLFCNNNPSKIFYNGRNKQFLSQSPSDDECTISNTRDLLVALIDTSFYAPVNFQKISGYAN